MAELKKYPGRTKSIHIKASGSGPEAVIGEDKLDWKSIFEICEGKGGTHLDAGQILGMNFYVKGIDEKFPGK